ncbi:MULTISPECIES: hypothetical protein [Haloarcula]|uniref:Uncharacterized protein n=1 Tax=Haloarcula pellucida TaxID=1427151 RepID=A0A830GPS7_9EURY|nr:MULTISPECIES: hypothetical protein [Halomicroarcula]MBX0349173.1 hypothetical protein [Halomicroarcula pellucida]MDS0279234.1 hypothetical protein [Halomicroarcula sp. S1AR25-4]GGN99355.1 hypothetical protein GCM10009030_30790 [Halomicroarcula pellucida]
MPDSEYPPWVLCILIGPIAETIGSGLLIHYNVGFDSVAFQTGIFFGVFYAVGIYALYSLYYKLSKKYLAYAGVVFIVLVQTLIWLWGVEVQGANYFVAGVLLTALAGLDKIARSVTATR